MQGSLGCLIAGRGYPNSDLIAGQVSSASYEDCVNSSFFNPIGVPGTSPLASPRGEVFCVETAQTIAAITVENYNFVNGQPPFIELSIEIWKYIPSS